MTSTRIRDLSPAERILHKAILRGFAATSRAPDAAALADEGPDGHDLGALLRELHDREVVRLDTRGQIQAAYPFSATPTAHVVAIDRGPPSMPYAPSTRSASPTCSAGTSPSTPPTQPSATRSP